MKWRNCSISHSVRFFYFFIWYSHLISKTWHGFRFFSLYYFIWNEREKMKAIQRSGFKKNNSNCAFPSMTEWRIHDNVYECEFDCMFSIRIYYVLILSLGIDDGIRSFSFFALCACVSECEYYLRFSIKCYHTDSMAVSTVRHFQCFLCRMRWHICKR